MKIKLKAQFGMKIQKMLKLVLEREFYSILFRFYLYITLFNMLSAKSVFTHIFIFHC